MNRRSLIQSAAALFVPTASVPLLIAPDNPRLERAVERYFETFTAFYGKPFRPDDNSRAAHSRATDDVDKRKTAFEGAKDELIRLVMSAHGLDSEKDDAPLRGLTVDVGGLTLVVSPHSDLNEDPCSPLGVEALALIPRTPAMRARLDALPTFDPNEWASDEEQERLGLPRYKPNVPEVDLSRMPAGEPVPIAVELEKLYHHEESGETEINRVWSPEGAVTCQRCAGCPFAFYTSETIESARDGLGRLRCEVTVKDEDLERVLYGPTPPQVEKDHTNDLMVETTWLIRDRLHPCIWDLVVTSRKDWEESRRAERDPSWFLVNSERGTRGNLVVAIRKTSGPLPVILEV